MRILRLVPPLAFAAALLAAASVPAAEAPPAPPAERPPVITYRDALILGLVEGVTEYLPVSSTGHLILANAILKLESDAPLTDRHGAPIPVRDDGALRPMTFNDAIAAYDIIIQGGAIVAVLILYWRRVWSLFRGLAGRDPAGRKLLVNLIAAFLPAAALGLLFEEKIEAYLFGVGPVLLALVAGSGLMFAVERWRKSRAAGGEDGPGPDLPELSWQQAVVIGLCQCVAMWPGTSRSMMTIVGGYFVGLRPARAAEFSFLLGLATLTAASGYKALKHGPAMLEALPAGPMLFGFAVATVSAALAVKWLVAWLTRHGLGIFAWYRLALAAVVAVWLWR